jgi:adenosylcobinamide-GDP ribazoletransferase
MGERSLLLGSVVVIIGLIAAASLRAWMAVGVIIAVTFLFGRFCRRRIGGITGDTLGANLQIGECAALLVFLWTAHAQ